MPSNKDRLYIVLHARGGKILMPGKEDTYHWALVVGPKEEVEGKKATRFDVHEKTFPDGGMRWVFEERSIALAPTHMTLVRILIAKIDKVDQLEKIICAVPVCQGDDTFNCVNWTKEALADLEASNVLGAHVTDWQKVRDTAMSYCQKKKDEHRFDGQGAFDITKIPTFDLLKGEETMI